MKKLLILAYFLFSISSVFAQTARTTSQAIHYIKLANTLREVHKSPESISLLKRALPAFVKHPYWQAVTNELLGLCYNDLHDSDNALIYLNKSLNQYARLKYVASAWAINEVIRDISGKNIYAGIHINSSDLKVAIFKTQYESEFYEKDIKAKFEIPNINVTDPGLTADAKPGLRAIPVALKSCLDTIQKYQIPAGRTFVVISKEMKQQLDKDPNKKRVLDEQLSSLFPSLIIDTTLSTKREAELFTIGAIPRVVWSSASSLTIGSTETIGGYFDSKKSFHPVIIPLGTQNLISQIEGTHSLSNSAFRKEALRVISKLVETPLKRLHLVNLTELNKRKTVGIGGDIPYAIASYLHPELAEHTAVPLSRADVIKFKELVLTNYSELTHPDLNAISDPSIRSKAEKDLSILQNKLTEKQLIAGALWMETLINAYGTEKEPKRFVFIRNADIGWVTGKFLETINYEYESTIAKGALYTR